MATVSNAIVVKPAGTAGVVTTFTMTTGAVPITLLTTGAREYATVRANITVLNTGSGVISLGQGAFTMQIANATSASALGVGLGTITASNPSGTPSYLDTSCEFTVPPNTNLIFSITGASTTFNVAYTIFSNAG